MVDTIDSIFPINFSNSMLQDVHKCELLFFRKYCQRLTRWEIKNPDLIAGGLFAKGCQIIREAYYNDKISVDEAIERGHNYILESEATGDYLKSNERVAFTLKKYFERYPLNGDLTPVQLQDGTYAIEYAFEFDLGIPHPEIPNQNLIYKGKLDGLYEKTYRGNRIATHVVDEKTTKTVSRLNGTKLVDIVKEEDKYRTDGQFIGYHWAARQLGVNTESSLVYKVPIAKEHEHAICLEIPINQFMIDSWYYSTVGKIRELLEKYRVFKALGENPNRTFYPTYDGYACMSYNSSCNFTEGCRSKDGEEILNSTYQQKVWLSSEQREVSLKEYKQKMGI